MDIRFRINIHSESEKYQHFFIGNLDVEFSPLQIPRMMRIL